MYTLYQPDEKTISFRGPKAWGLILVEFRRGEIFIYISNAEFCFCKQITTEKMMYNLNTN